MAKKDKQQTGGLQEKKVKVALTKEQIKQQKLDEKKKRQEKKKAEKKEKISFWRRITSFFAELKKVNWPTVGKTFKQTGVVLGFVLIFAVIVFGLDQGLSQLYKLLVNKLNG